MKKQEKKQDLNDQIIKLILSKKKGVSAGTAAQAYNRIKEALKAMER